VTDPGARVGRDDDELRRAVRAEIARVAAAERLKPFEVPRDVIVEHEPFSRENGLLTALRKRIRPAIQRTYQDRLVALYAQIARTREADLESLRRATDRPVLERVMRAVGVLLGVDASEAHASSSFAELGGDSLAATELSV